MIGDLTDSSKKGTPEINIFEVKTYLALFIYVACSICGVKSAVVCETCQSDGQHSINYCQHCSNLFHKNPCHKERAEHKLSPIQNEDPLGDPDLLSVICIETSHYVCFTRDPRDDGEKRWIFFDSMADRQCEFKPYYTAV